MSHKTYLKIGRVQTYGRKELLLKKKSARFEPQTLKYLCSGPSTLTTRPLQLLNVSSKIWLIYFV